MKQASRVLWLRIYRYAALTLAAASVVLVFRTWIHVNQTTIALTFLVMVLTVATRWRLAYSVYLSVLCTVLYNFFFLPPLGKLTIADPQNWVTLFAFLVTSVLVSHLSASERRQAELSESRREEVERLYEFSQQMLLLEDPREIARATPSLIARIFHLRAVALYVNDDEVYYADPDGILLSAIDLKQFAQASDAQTVGSSAIRVLPLTLGMRTAGALAITRAEYTDEMYEAIGSVVAIALERASALERFGRVEAARESDRLRTALLDSLTHELRTPLTAIRAAATSLVSQHSLGEAERKEMHAIVDEESARLDRLIGQALEMAQLDAAAIRVVPELRSIREVIDIALEDSRPLLHDHPIQLRIPPDLGAVPMDRELVRRVLRHLLENAAKYSPRGAAIEVESAIDQYRWTISVIDHGPGIEAVDLPFIFDKFYRGSRERERIQGTGMGLAIVRAMLQAHGGGIDVRSTPGKGTTFTAWIPAESEAARRAEYAG
jgi:two-component system sensor histidine kinase KdpD